MRNTGDAMTRPRLAAIAAGLCLGALLAGCAGREAPTRDGAVAPAPEPAPAAAFGPRGLEVQVWIVDDLGGQVAGVLAELEEPAGVIDSADARRWRDSGLRVVGVPADRVEELRGRLRLAAPVRREWVGQVLAWRPVALGPELVRERVTTATGPLWVDSGRLRLMTRAWAAPRVRAGQAPASELRLEFVPQLVLPGGAQTLAEIESRLRGELPTPGEDGPVLEGLALSVAVGAGEALIIVGEAPDADWAEQARLAAIALEPAPDDSTGPHASEGVPGTPEEGGWRAPGPAPSRVADPWEAVAGGVGPGAPEGRTLGESMLSGRLATRVEEVGEGRVLRPRRRALIVLIPRAGGVYTIAPAPGRAPG